MNPQLVQQANLVIADPHLLINLVSRRVRQLGSGSRPMVEAGVREGTADLALREIIAGKLQSRPRPEV
jgi:DNA-directed RNA polymerase subunit omega